MHVLSVVSEFLIAAGLVHRLVLKLLVIALYLKNSSLKYCPFWER